MNSNWQRDPRIKNINPQKLSILKDFAQRVESVPKDQLFPTLITINMEANQKGIHFTDDETDLLFTIMSAHMSPTERQRMETFRLLSQNLVKSKKN